jgi:hypothetical protein
MDHAQRIGAVPYLCLTILSTAGIACNALAGNPCLLGPNALTVVAEKKPTSRKELPSFPPKGYGMRLRVERK